MVLIIQWFSSYHSPTISSSHCCDYCCSYVKRWFFHLIVCITYMFMFMLIICCFVRTFCHKFDNLSLAYMLHNIISRNKKRYLFMYHKMSINQGASIKIIVVTVMTRIQNHHFRLEHVTGRGHFCLRFDGARSI